MWFQIWWRVVSKICKDVWVELVDSVLVIKISHGPVDNVNGGLSYIKPLIIEEQIKKL